MFIGNENENEISFMRVQFVCCPEAVNFDAGGEGVVVNLLLLGRKSAGNGGRESESIQSKIKTVFPREVSIYNT